ncbi:MAG: hypothetical protein ACFCBW_22410 [Candidatus Competibacterales bacterium]
MTEDRQRPIQPADPRARRRVLVLILLGGALGGGLLWAFEAYRPQWVAWVADDPATRMPQLMAGLTVLVVLPLVGFAAHLWWLGRRVLVALRFPPPGMAVSRDTPIATGAAARRRGIAFQVGAGLLLVLGTGMGFYLWQLGQAFARLAGESPP